jgi:uncharacterized protein (TIGR00730 family)
MKTVTVFGSSQPKPGDNEYKFAENVGKALAKNGFTVCNGGYTGTMEASSKGAVEEGGKAIGITVKTLNYVPHNKYLTEDIVMPDMFSRIQKLMSLGDAFIVLKGGTGTLVELALAWEFVNKGFEKNKPIIIADKFWEPMINMFTGEKSLGEFYNKDGVIVPCTNYLKSAYEVDDIIDHLKNTL